MSVLKSFKLAFLRIFALVLIVSFLSACTSKSDLASNDSAGDFQNQLSESQQASEDADPGMDGASEDEKIISSYYMNLETLDFDKSKNGLDDLIKSNKGFIENSNIGFSGYEYSKNYRYADFSLRIPKDNLESFKKGLTNIGSITSESSNTENVSKYYRDTQSRLNLVSAKEKRLLELLEKAEKIEDIIIIESELTETIFEKESLEKDLKSIDEKIEYTSVNLQLLEVRNLSSRDKLDSSLISKLKNAFKDSISTFKIAMENFIIWLVYALPYIFILGILAFLALIFIRRRNKKL